MLSNTDRYVEINDFEKDLVAFTDSIRMNSDNLIEFIDKERWINTKTFRDKIIDIKYLKGQKEILNNHNCFEYYLNDIYTKHVKIESGSNILVKYSITKESFQDAPKSEKSIFNNATTKDDYDITYLFFLKDDIVNFKGILIAYHFPIKAYRQCEEQ